MNDYFLKLDKKHNFKNSSFIVKDEVVRYGVEHNGKFYGIKYFEVDWQDQVSPLNFFPESIRNLLRIRYMMINHSVVPHTDSQIDMTVNFYMNTTDEETNFYEPLVKDPKIMKLQNQTNGSVFDIEQLEKKCSFTAKEDEIFLLNVGKIHSVMKNDTVSPLPSLRQAIVVNSLSLSYKEMINYLKV
jgi:hypothetical protein